MRVIPALWLFLTLSVGHAQNITVRYEPLRNMDIVSDRAAWAESSVSRHEGSVIFLQINRSEMLIRLSSTQEHWVRSYGLSFEWLNVTTKDNATLGIHHLWNPRVNGTKIPVLTFPPLAADGDVFLLNRPEGNFIMTLANQGYDVFLGNFRTSRYSSATPRQLHDAT